MATVADGASSVPSIRALENGRFGCMSALDQREHLGCFHGRTLHDYVGPDFFACVGGRAVCTFRDGSEEGCLALDSRRRRIVELGSLAKVRGAIGGVDRRWAKRETSNRGN